MGSQSSHWDHGLPEAVKRKHTQSAKPRGNKKNFGKSIDLRPEIASQRTEEGHWKGDTVVGKRAGKDAVVFSLLEKKTENYMAFLIPEKTSEAVMAAMQMLKEEYGNRFAQVFKTITVDNGLSSQTLRSAKAGALRCSSPIPTPHGNGLKMNATTDCFGPSFPRALPCRTTLLSIFYRPRMSLNARPRKKLGYATPEELFDSFLDRVYAVDSKPS